VLAQGFFGPLSAGAGDALVDGQCLLQELGSFAGVAVVKVGSADSFQGAGFFQGHAEFAGEGQCAGVALAGLLGGCGAGG
jgi:hypothetical protein